MTHKHTAYAQFILTLVFLTGYFIVFRAFISGQVAIDPEWKDTVGNLVSVLTAGVLMILAYWFQRQRNSTDSETK